MALSDFIIENMEEILGEWEKFAATLPSMKHTDAAALRDHAEMLLRTIARDMQQPQSAEQQAAKSKGQTTRPAQAAETAAESHGTARFAQGLDIAQLVAEYRALRASVVRIWTTKTPNADSTLYELTRFNEGIDEALAESIERFSAALDRSRELLMGVLGHDLRNPLGVILQSAQLLAMQPDVGGVPAKAAERILNSGRRAEQLITDLLDVTRTRLGGMLPITRAAVDLRHVCHQAVDEARAHHPDRVVTLTHEGDLTGHWDRARLLQMLSNLLENGLRHGSDDGTVAVMAHGEPDVAVLEVHNKGAPIPAAIINKVFDALFQADGAEGHENASSLGLGLYICRAIAEAHGGSICVESSAQEGTTFVTRLPRRPPRPNKPAP
jgi:signal transduction histidine kinase